MSKTYAVQVTMEVEIQVEADNAYEAKEEAMNEAWSAASSSICVGEVTTGEVVEVED